LLSRELERRAQEPDETTAARLHYLRECLAAVGEQGRQFITWRYTDELPLQEMSNRSGRSVAAIKKQLWLLRQKLQQCIVYTLWYFEPREQPCLQIQYGMDLDRKVINPPGWTGVFRKAEDGKSYTLECAIPWSLLGAGDDPPRAGDELGLCWIVNWSDASGRRWRGQLIEDKNPAYAGRGEKFLTFVFADTWGKAIYK
jgi:hypothetical protein